MPPFPKLTELLYAYVVRYSKLPVLSHFMYEFRMESYRNVLLVDSS